MKICWCGILIKRRTFKNIRVMLIKGQLSLMLGVILMKNANNNKVLGEIFSVRKNFVLDEASQRHIAR